MQQHLRAWLSLSTGRTVQSVNNTLLSLRADDAADAFNQALASQYSSASNSYSADKLKQGLNALRARQQDRRELHSHTNMYPIS
jgi:hydroxymethylpyrimidine pyrophosphatase-like HAD family hydrolase